MNNCTYPTPADIGFLRNTGLALVFLTLIAGSISLAGSLALLPAGSEIDSYGIDDAPAPEVMTRAG